MQKFFTQKAFLLLTLLFVCIAALSFVAFQETEEACANACKAIKHAQNNHILWEVFSRPLFSLVSI